MNANPYDAIIVGGGHNGLVCAAYLARAGLDVLVLERRHVLGGACTTEEIFPGYHVSTCSYVVHILQDKIVRDLDLYEHGYEVQPLDPVRFFPLHDDWSLLHWQDVGQTCQEIEKFSKRDALGYRRWIDFWAQAGSLLNRYFLSEPPTIPELCEHVRGTEDEALLDRLLKGTLTELLDELFETDEVKATVMHSHDMKDADAPGVLFGSASIKPGQLVNPRNQGIVKGGMGTLTRAMAQAAQRFGAKIRIGAEVQRILVERGRVQGVELTDGQVLRGKLVISNADPKRTFLGLVDAAHLETSVTDMIKKLDTDFGTLKFHAAVSELPDFSRYLGRDHDLRYLAMIHICPSTDYYRKSARDAIEGLPARHPIIDIQIPTVYDPSIAPEGKHIVSMWVRYEPVRPKGASWDALRKQEGEWLIDKLTVYAPNFKESIIDWLLYTPADLERRVYLTDGNIHHTTHVPNQLLGHRLFARGGYRTPIKGLYMCGAGTHPGGEVSGAPGHNAAHAVLADWTS
jgi:phytoene dehydrogenase-like protein